MRKTHRYEPRGSARQVFESRAPEIVVSGSAGTGKSRACLEKIAACAAKYPGSRHLILRQTLESLKSTGLVTWNEYVIPELRANGKVEFYGGGPEEPPQYRFWNGSTVMVGGLDKPTKIMSAEYDMVFVQEATQLVITGWEFGSTRLRNGKMPYQQIIADCNPGPPTHWLKARTEGGPATMLYSVHEENPRLYQQVPEGTPGATLFDNGGRPIWVVLTAQGRDYMARLDALTGVRYLRLRKGLWVAAEGLIYEHFDPAKHLVDPFEIPRHWPRYWSVDFGFRHPMVIQMWAQDDDGRLFMYREVYRTGRTVPEVAAEALALVTDEAGKWTEPQPLRLITDHQLAERFSLEHALDMGSTPAHKVVTEGIQAVQARLGKPATAEGGAVAPRLFLMRGATAQRDQAQADALKPTSTEDEFPAYVWADNGKEQPVKENDDGMDAMRYLVADRDLGSDTFFRGWI